MLARSRPQRAGTSCTPRQDDWRHAKAGTRSSQSLENVIPTKPIENAYFSCRFAEVLFLRPGRYGNRFLKDVKYVRCLSISSELDVCDLQPGVHPYEAIATSAFTLRND
jgi:hypothetical protein